MAYDPFYRNPYITSTNDYADYRYRTVTLEELHHLGYACTYNRFRDTVTIVNLHQSPQYSAEFSTHHITHCSLSDIVRQYEYSRTMSADFPNPGPTNKQLKDERIKRAYEELQILIKLIE